MNGGEFQYNLFIFYFDSGGVNDSIYYENVMRYQPNFIIK